MARSRKYADSLGKLLGAKPAKVFYASGITPFNESLNHGANGRSRSKNMINSTVSDARPGIFRVRIFFRLQPSNPSALRNSSIFVLSYLPLLPRSITSSKTATLYSLIFFLRFSIISFGYCFLIGGAGITGTRNRHFGQNSFPGINSVPQLLQTF